jgi:hypothetical protein
MLRPPFIFRPKIACSTGSQELCAYLSSRNSGCLAVDKQPVRCHASACFNGSCLSSVERWGRPSRPRTCAIRRWGPTQTASNEVPHAGGSRRHVGRGARSALCCPMSEPVRRTGSGPEISCSCRHTILQPSGHAGRSPTRKPPIGMGRAHRCVGLGAIASKRKSARCTADGLNVRNAKMCACIALVPGRRNWDGTDDGRLDHSAGSRQRHV